MANTKISDLSANATQVNSTDVFPSVQTAGVGPVKTTAAQLKTFVNDGATHTGVTAFPAGSAAAPSIIPTGDTNTGIWFPATGTVAISTGGTSRMRVDSSGNVGIGTTSPVCSLDVNGALAQIRLNSTTATNAVYHNIINSGGNLFIGRENSAGTAFSTNAYASVVYSAGAYPLVFFTNSTEKMRITSAGNVGIGTTAPSALLDVNSNTIRVRTAKTPASASDTGNAGDICWDSGYVYVCVATNTWKRAAIATW